MIVVADTSALNYLVLLNRAEILQTLYKRVVIPHAVREEMLADGAPSVVCAWAANFPIGLTL